MPIVFASSTRASGDTGNCIEVKDLDAGLPVYHPSAPPAAAGFATRIDVRVPSYEVISINDAAAKMLPHHRTAVVLSLTAQRNLELPCASQVKNGTKVTVSDPRGLVSAARILTVRTNGDTNNDLINGATSIDLTTPYSQRTFTSDGVTRWAMSAS
jgi:hypothetical protein